MKYINVIFLLLLAPVAPQDTDARNLRWGPWGPGRGGGGGGGGGSRGGQRGSGGGRGGGGGGGGNGWGGGGSGTTTSATTTTTTSSGGPPPEMDAIDKLLDNRSEIRHDYKDTSNGVDTWTYSETTASMVGFNNTWRK